MGLRAMPHGPVDSESVQLGTLELLTDEDVVGPATPDATDGAKRSQGALFRSGRVDPEVVQDVEERRIVIMNPPFSADEKKGRSSARK